MAVVDAVPDEDVDKRLATEYADTYRVADELLPGGERHESLRYGARQELGLRAFLGEGGRRAFTTNFEDLGGSDSPRPRGPTADGGRLRVRR